MAAPSPGSARCRSWRNALSMKAAKTSARNLLEPHHRAGLVERAARADHLLHQARLGAGEHVADLPLMLRRGAQRVLDAAAVEAVDRLELVERDDDRALALGGQPAGQREDLVGQPVDVARGRAPAERRPRSGRRPRCVGLVADLRARRGDGAESASRARAPIASRPRPARGRSLRERRGRSCSC